MPLRESVSHSSGGKEASEYPEGQVMALVGQKKLTLEER